jgi:hypothetical protein
MFTEQRKFHIPTLQRLGHEYISKDEVKITWKSISEFSSTEDKRNLPFSCQNSLFKLPTEKIRTSGTALK